MSATMSLMLRKLIEDYLLERGWYRDAPTHDPYGRPYAKNEIDADRFWTLPEWEEYWSKPYKPEEPKERRYVDFEDAIRVTLSEEAGRWSGVAEERSKEWRDRA